MRFRCLLLVVVPFASAAQPVVEWEQSIGTVGDESPAALAVTAQGDILVGANAEDGVLLSRLGPDGSHEWTTSLDVGRLTALAATGDEGAVLTHTQTGVGSRPPVRSAVTRVGPLGDPVWHRDLDPGSAGPCTSDDPICVAEVLSVASTPDGGAIVGGTLGFPRAGVPGQTPDSYPWDGWLVKLDGAGEVEWERAYGGPSYDVIRSVLPTSDGGYAFTGINMGFRADESAPPSRAFWVGKVDGDGDLLWERGLWRDGLHTVEHGGTVLRERPDGDLVVAGDCNGNTDTGAWEWRICVVRLGPDGDVPWMYRSPFPHGWDNGSTLRGLALLEPGRVAVLGMRTASDRPQTGEPLYFSPNWLGIVAEGGGLERERVVGAGPTDNPKALGVTGDGDLIVLSEIGGTGHDVSTHLGGRDSWVARVPSDFSNIPVPAASGPEASGPLRAAVFPNPTSHGATLRVDAGGRPVTAHVAVYDALGRRVVDLGPRRGNGTVEFALDTEALAPGVYGVRVVSEEGSAVSVFTVSR